MTTFPAAQMIDTNGVTLEVFEAGPKDGRPVLMAHGFPELAWSWRHQIPWLAAAGYHVIVPNQRGYGGSSRPEEVEAYDTVQLTADLAGLLDHFGHEKALFVGHDWGAAMVWNMALLHGDRVDCLINLSVPFAGASKHDPIDSMEHMFGPEFYMVHFNRQPGVADAIFAENTEQFLRNMYRTDGWLDPEGLKAVFTGRENRLAQAAQALDVPGTLLMSESELKVFVDTFKRTGFTGGINWYRNISRNWELTKDLEQLITQQALMIYGTHDMVPPAKTLQDRVPNVEIATLDCGHWIQQERAAETNTLMQDWMAKHYPA